jgi:hypothetical protein
LELLEKTIGMMQEEIAFLREQNRMLMGKINV